MVLFQRAEVALVYRRGQEYVTVKRACIVALRYLSYGLNSHEVSWPGDGLKSGLISIVSNNFSLT